MKIEYIKPAPNGPAGMIDDVTEFEGNVLIATGFAKAVEPTEPKPKAKAKSKPKANNSGTDTDDGTKTETTDSE